MTTPTLAVDIYIARPDIPMAVGGTVMLLPAEAPPLLEGQAVRLHHRSGTWYGLAERVDGYLIYLTVPIPGLACGIHRTTPAILKVNDAADTWIARHPLDLHARRTRRRLRRARREYGGAKWERKSRHTAPAR